jgi:circadian clock protein KaiB
MLRLYIAGNSASSQRARKNLAQLRKHMKANEWKIEVIDVLLQPDIAEKAGILATPTLSYDQPARPRRIIGDLSDTRRVLEFLGIEPSGDVT